MFLLSTAAKDLRRRLRDPLGLLLWLVIPMVVGGILTLAFGGEDGPRPQARVLIVDQDGGLLANLLVRALGQQAQSPFAGEQTTLEAGRRRIDAGDGTALLVIPPGFSRAVLREEPSTLTLVTNPSQQILPAMVSTSLELLVDAVFYAHRLFGEPLRAALAESSSDESATLPDATIARAAVAINAAIRQLSPALTPPVLDVEIAATPPREATRGFGELFFPSMLLMTVLFMAGGLAEDVWREKDQGTLRRALSAPHSVLPFFLGKLLASFVLFAGVGLFALAAGRWGFGIDLASPAVAALWVAVTGVLFTSLFVLLQLHASRPRTGGLLVSFMTFPLLMAGGSFFPFELMPEWMARFGRLTPNGWALEVLKGILAGNAEPAALAWALSILLALTAALSVWSMRRMAGAFARG